MNYCGLELFLDFTWDYILGQVFGVIALGFFIFSFQIKDPRKSQLLFIPGNIAYGIQYILLGSLAGGIILFSSAVRDGAGAYASPHLLKFFVILHLAIATLTLGFLGNSWAEGLILLSAILSSVAALYRDDFMRFRSFILGRQLAILTFNLWIGSIAGAIHLSFTLASNMIGLYRYKYKKSNELSYE